MTAFRKLVDLAALLSLVALAFVILSLTATNTDPPSRGGGPVAKADASDGYFLGYRIGAAYPVTERTKWTSWPLEQNAYRCR
jgi:hypothetical protein